MGGMSVIGLIGLYLYLVHIGLIDSLLVVGLIYAANTVPFVTWYLKTYFDSVPRDFDEAALMDGASFIQSMRYVVIPIAKPGILVAIIFVSIITWSEWVIAGILLGPENFTLPVGLVTLQGRWETPWNRFAAMSIIYSLPLVMLFMLSRRYMEAGMTLGGIKG
jgi:arabinogalactan oligomer/maltooligosaccharide transport system permease protein